MTDKALKRASYAALTLPSVLIYASVIVFPVLFSFTLSFTRWTGFGSPQFVGLSQYVTILRDLVFRHGLRNNLLIVAISIFGQIPLGFVLAYIIYRKLVAGAGFFEPMIFLPITISAVVVAILWNQIFSPAGIYTALMRTLRDDPRYVLEIFESRAFAIVPILFVVLWMYTGIYSLVHKFCDSS